MKDFLDWFFSDFRRVVLLAFISSLFASLFETCYHEVKRISYEISNSIRQEDKDQ